LLRTLGVSKRVVLLDNWRLFIMFTKRLLLKASVL
jgi:hypothetical protein